MSTGANGDASVLWIGPGPRLAKLAPLLASIPSPCGLRDLARIADLSLDHSSAGAVLIDADALRSQDIYDLQRFITQPSAAAIFLIGEDAGRRGVRALLRSDRVRWVSWPPDIEDMHAIVLCPIDEASSISNENHSRASSSSSPRARSESPAGSVAGRARSERESTPSSPASASSLGSELDLDPAVRGAVRVPHVISAEIAEIERVLGAGWTPGEETASAIAPIAPIALGRPAEEYGTRAPREAVSAPRIPTPADPSAEEMQDVAADVHAHRPDVAPHPHETPRALPANDPPESFRAQVADLADIAQRIELSLHGLRDAQSDATESPDAAGAIESADAIESIGREVARLVQFARTLGYLVSPPGPGVQLFDLTEMLEVFLSEIRSAGPDAPRCLLRSNGALTVRSDRQLLSQAFDALFFLARSAAGRGEIVRVQARREEDSGRSAARVSIDFPGGRLLDLPTAAILEPYGLRRIVPDLGPNALSAAVRIIQGQGGRCVLATQSRGRLEWSVTLPLAAVEHAPSLPSAGAVSGAGAVSSESSRLARADDPFA